MPAIIFFELGRSGRFETSSFQGLSAGNTCKAARTLSASGVLNWIGRVISGIFGRPADGAASAAHSSRGGTSSWPTSSGDGTGGACQGL
jgi:hypothetical protein